MASSTFCEPVPPQPQGDTVASYHIKAAMYACLQKVTIGWEVLLSKGEDLNHDEEKRRKMIQ